MVDVKEMRGWNERTLINTNTLQEDHLNKSLLLPISFHKNHV